MQIDSMLLKFVVGCGASGHASGAIGLGKEGVKSVYSSLLGQEREGIHGLGLVEDEEDDHSRNKNQGVPNVPVMLFGWPLCH